MRDFLFLKELIRLGYLTFYGVPLVLYYTLNIKETRMKRMFSIGLLGLLLTSCVSALDLKPGKLYDLKDLVTKDRSSVTVFDELIKQYDVVIDFYAPWCGPCRNMHPHMEALAKELADCYKNLIVIQINVDREATISNRYGVRSLPTFYLIKKDGSKVLLATGAQPRKVLKAAIEKALK